MDKIDWLDKFHAATHNVNEAIGDLQEIYYALGRVGLRELATEILTIHHILKTESENITDAVTQNINESLKRSQESSALMLKTAMAGIILGRKENENDHHA